MKKYLFSFYTSCILFAALSQKQFKILSRDKRTLIWREGASRLQIIAGLGMPIDVKPENVIIGTVIKANYYLPTNVTELRTPYVLYERRRKRSPSRWEIYDVLAQMLQMRGIVGRPCVLKMICELANVPLDKNYGLFNELIHMVFNPKSTNEVVRSNADNEYFAAHKMGKTSEQACQSIFSECKINMLDLFTM